MNLKTINKNTSFSAIFFIIGTIALMTGCLSVKNSSANSGMNLFETFFVGDDGIQYFIKPLTFMDDNKNRLILDITFRYKDKIKDSASVNISFINSEIIRDIDSLKLSNNTVSIVSKNFKYLFSERMKSEFNSRYTTKSPLLDIYRLFDNENWNVIVYTKNKQTQYYTPENTKKKIIKLKYGIFMLF
jgi:hypothetical protein